MLCCCLDVEHSLFIQLTCPPKVSTIFSTMERFRTIFLQKREEKKFQDAEIKHRKVQKERDNDVKAARYFKDKMKPAMKDDASENRLINGVPQQLEFINMMYKATEVDRPICLRLYRYLKTMPGIHTQMLYEYSNGEIDGCHFDIWYIDDSKIRNQFI